VVGGVVFYHLLTPVSFANDQLFEVYESESLSSIASRLEKRAIIKSAFWMRVYSWLRGTEKRFKKGEYLLKTGSNMVEIHDQIVSGKQLLVRVILKEGWTSTKMAKALEEQQIIKADDFLQATRDPKIIKNYNIPSQTLEGFLYPDTYFFPRNSSPEMVVNVLVQRFFQVLGTIIPEEKLKETNTWFNTIVLASIIEREYRVREEAPIISSVFFNRLRYNIPLASCATVEYIITEIQGKPHPKRIFFADTEIPSPFNTYINRGLPPNPISNPGRIALNAAFNPATTDYLFFVVKDPRLGTHTFSKTIADHMAAREVYLEMYTPKL